MPEQAIEEIINNNLPIDYRENALDFIRFLRDKEMELIRDTGFWKDKIDLGVKSIHLPKSSQLLYN